MIEDEIMEKYFEEEKSIKYYALFIMKIKKKICLK